MNSNIKDSIVNFEKTHAIDCDFLFIEVDVNLLTWKYFSFF